MWMWIERVAFSLTLGGCCTFTLPYYTTEFNSHRPKVNRFALSKKGPGDTILIDFDAIYAKPPKEEYIKTVDGYEKIGDDYTFIRFFKEGQILVGWTSSLDNIKK